MIWCLVGWTSGRLDAWGSSQGEAIHTQTFLGNPTGCAMALACMDVIETLLPSVKPTGMWLKSRLEELGLTIRGRGLLLGIELDDSLAVSRALLSAGYIALPAGDHGEVLAITPPLCITRVQLDGFVDALNHVLS